ncbi:hypothetical protein ACTXT7_016556 [Hymenolepis weldensis]
MKSPRVHPFQDYFQSPFHPNSFVNYESAFTVFLSLSLSLSLSQTEEHDEDWVTYVCRLNTVCELCDFSANSKDRFKCLPFLVVLGNFAIMIMLEAVEKITLEDNANKCINLDFKCDGSMNQQNSGGHSYINGISSETVPKCSTLRKTLTVRWLCIDLRLPNFVQTNVIFAKCMLNEGIRK